MENANRSAPKHAPTHAPTFYQSRSPTQVSPDNPPVVCVGDRLAEKKTFVGTYLYSRVPQIIGYYYAGR